MDTMERLSVDNVSFSWNKSAQPKPVPQQASVNNTPRKRRKPRMQRRRLCDDEVCIHNVPGTRSVTFNGSISKEAFAKSMKYVYVDVLQDSLLVLFCSKKRQNDDTALLTYNSSVNRPSAVFSNKKFVTIICNFFSIKEGDYYATIEKKSSFVDSFQLLYEITSIREKQPSHPEEQTIQFNEQKTCTKCGRTLPLSEFYKKSYGGYQSQCKDCCKEHGRLRNGYTGEYRQVTLTSATPKQLWQELKSRGARIVDNQLIICETLE